MAIVKDLDFTLDSSTSTNDFLTLEDEAAIKNTLYNNLFVGQYERKYYDGEIESIENLLFEPVDPITKRLLKNTISNAIDKDNRIKRLNKIELEYNDVEDAYYVKIKLELDLTERNKDVNISLILRRQ
jgi:hypothetical protein